MTVPSTVMSPAIKDRGSAILKAEVCRGVFEGGRRPHGNELATRRGISRSPVREALRDSPATA